MGAAARTTAIRAASLVLASAAALTARAGQRSPAPAILQLVEAAGCQHVAPD